MRSSIMVLVTYYNSVCIVEKNVDNTSVNNDTDKNIDRSIEKIMDNSSVMISFDRYSIELYWSF